MECRPNVKFPVYILVILFGMGSWVAVNGLWMELPILVDNLPEGWNLPSYITVIIQIANIGPIIYTLLNKYAPNRINEKHGVLLIIVIGALACLLLVFTWNKKTSVGGVQHSTWLLVCVLLLALVDCTSSVVFLPYMSLFKSQYISALYIGEGLSGLVPSLIAVGQGVGKFICQNKTANNTETKMTATYEKLHFPVEDFFYVLLSIILICGIAFALLEYLPYCKDEHVSLNNRRHSNKSYLESNLYSEFEKTESCVALYFTGEISRRKYIFLLFLIGLINAMTNGILPSISSYANAPYGEQAYHLSTTLSSAASPVICLLIFFRPILSTVIITVTALTGCGLGTYILVIAAYSPSPPMVNQTIGAVLIVTVSVLVSAFMSFSKVSIANVLRNRGRTALLWCGIITQIGSALGAILMFIIVNQLHMFYSKQPCT